MKSMTIRIHHPVWVDMEVMEVGVVGASGWAICVNIRRRGAGLCVMPALNQPNSPVSYQQCSKQRGNQERKWVWEGEEEITDKGFTPTFPEFNLSLTISQYSLYLLSLEFFRASQYDTGPIISQILQYRILPYGPEKSLVAFKSRTRGEQWV